VPHPGRRWRQATVARYGRTDTVRLAEVVCLWYGAFGKRTGRLIAAAEGAGEEAGSCWCSPPT